LLLLGPWFQTVTTNLFRHFFTATASNHACEEVGMFTETTCYVVATSIHTPIVDKQKVIYSGQIPFNFKTFFFYRNIDV